MSTHPAIPLIAQFEGFRSSPYWDVNHYRVGYGSDTITKPDGSVSEVKPGMSVTQADAQRDLDRRTTETQAKIKDSVGEAAWNKLTPGAQAALTSVSYNYGHLPWSVQSAAASGDPSAIARSINGLAGDNNGVNAKRRQTEANAVLGIGAPIGSLGLGGPEGDHPIASASKTPSPTPPPVDPLQGRSLLELALAKANGGKPVEHLLTNGLKSLFPAGDKAEPLTEGRSMSGSFPPAAGRLGPETNDDMPFVNRQFATADRMPNYNPDAPKPSAAAAPPFILGGRGNAPLMMPSSPFDAGSPATPIIGRSDLSPPTTTPRSGDPFDTNTNNSAPANVNSPDYRPQSDNMTVDIPGMLRTLFGGE